MNFDEYQSKATTFANNSLGKYTALATWSLGIAGEAGEVADHVKKYIGHGHPLDKEKIAKELGDVLWYLAMMSDQLGLDLSDVAEMNIKKLKKRYGEKFSIEASLNREPE